MFFINPITVHRLKFWRAKFCEVSIKRSDLHIHVFLNERIQLLFKHKREKSHTASHLKYANEWTG